MFGSVLSEDWTCKDLYGFQKGLSHLEQNFRWEKEARINS